MNHDVIRRMDSGDSPPPNSVYVSGATCENNHVSLDNRVVNYNITINVNIPENATKEQLTDIKSILLDSMNTLKSEDDYKNEGYNKNEDYKSDDIDTASSSCAVKKRRWFG